MHQQRPSMHARDSSGRQVSLLNDEPSRNNNAQLSHPDYPGCDPSTIVRSSSDRSIRSGTSSPDNPGLIRANSYDSQNTNDANSPITPTYGGEFGKSSYAALSYKDTYEAQEHSYSQPTQYSMPVRPYPEPRGSPYGDSYSVSYEEDPYQPTKGGKRYPCRFKESHGCDRTFTTSGHASRHSKIHTAEKAVNCSHPGCPKKFTRADNMKQHLETHFKDRSRSSTSQKAASKSNLTSPSGVKKPTTTSNGRSSRNSVRGSDHRPELPPMMDPALFDPQYTLSNYGPLNMSGIQAALVAPSTAPNGLDALAAAAAGYQG